MLLRYIQPHTGQFLIQLPGRVTAVIGQEQIFLPLVIEPLDKLRHTGQDTVSMVDDTVHITDKALFLVKINRSKCVHMLSSFYRIFTFTVSFHAMNFHPKTVKFLITLANRMTENPNLHIRSRLGFSTDWEQHVITFRSIAYLRFLQPLLELLQRDNIPVAFLFLFSGLFTPGVELTVADAARLDPRKAPLVFPAVCLEYRVIGLLQCPLLKTPTLSTLPLTQKGG